MDSQIYNQARYYEITFGFIDPKGEVDLFEAFIKKYSKIDVKSVIDIACGTGLQLRELAKRGYRSIGLDFSLDMLSFLKKESISEKTEVETINADMNNFKIDEKVDFAYIAMGSIVYTQNNELFLLHLESVAQSLNPGGLYLIENMIINWADPEFWKPQSWDMEVDGIKVKTNYQLLPKDSLKQIVTQVIELEVDDGGKKTKLVDRDDLKVIFPEELKLLIEKNGKFELIGFFERDSIEPLKEISSMNTVVLRRI